MEGAVGAMASRKEGAPETELVAPALASILREKNAFESSGRPDPVGVRGIDGQFRDAIGERSDLTPRGGPVGQEVHAVVVAGHDPGGRDGERGDGFGGQAFRRRGPGAAAIDALPDATTDGSGVEGARSLRIGGD